MNPAPSGSYGRTHQQPVNLEEMGQMPKVSRESAENVADMGAAEDRGSELDGYAVTIGGVGQSGHELRDLDTTACLRPSNHNPESTVCQMRTAVTLPRACMDAGARLHGGPDAG